MVSIAFVNACVCCAFGDTAVYLIIKGTCLVIASITKLMRVWSYPFKSGLSTSYSETASLGSFNLLISAIGTNRINGLSKCE